MAMSFRLSGHVCKARICSVVIILQMNLLKGDETKAYEFSAVGADVWPIALLMARAEHAGCLHIKNPRSPYCCTGLPHD